MAEVFDLFGNPVEAGTGKPGRPRKDATPEDRNKVKMLLAFGWSNDRMARTLRMSLPTFRRNFFQELKERDAARDMLDARRIEIAMGLANDGNVGALKELGKMLEKSDLMGMERRLRDAQSDEKSKDELVNAAAPQPGKKEAAKAAAKTAGDGSTWGDDLKPGIH